MKLFWVIFFLPVVYSMSYPGDSLLQKKPAVIKNKAGYLRSIAGKPGFEMTDLQSEIPGIAFDIRYASANNFFHKKIYPSVNTTYCRKKAAAALAGIQLELNKKGLGLKIFDAYRPYSVTQKIWQQVKDERFAANPAKGSNHNRGAAIDLTIINISTGEALDMGTDFDSFSDSAHHNFTSFPEAILQNRQLLKSVMLQYGFEIFETEWWHYTLPDAKQYELMDLSFEQVRKLTRYQ